jgi:hypothetical protein
MFQFELTFHFPLSLISRDKLLSYEASASFEKKQAGNSPLL